MRWGRGLAAAFLALFLCLAPAFAYEEAVVRGAELAAEKFRANLQTIQTDLQNPAIAADKLADHRRALEDIRTSSLSQLTALDAPFEEVNQQIGLLGTPAEGQAESPEVAAQRKLLNDSLSRLLGAKAQLDLVAAEADQLVGRASSIQRDQFFQRIFEGNRSIVNPQLWVDTGIGFKLFVERLGVLYANWWRDIKVTANYWGLTAIPGFIAICALGWGLLRKRLRRSFSAGLAAHPAPGDIERLWRVVRAILLTLVVLNGLLLPIVLILHLSGFMTPLFDLVFGAVTDVILTTLLFVVIGQRLASPALPNWRILDLDEGAAARLPILIILAAFGSALAQRLGKVTDGLYLPVTYTIGQSAVAAAAMVIILALILLTLRNQTGLAEKSPGRRVYFTWAASLVPVAWLLLAVAAAALLFGYIALARFITLQIFDTAVLVTMLFLLHHLSDTAVAASIDPQSGFGRFLRRFTRFGERAIERAGLFFRTFVDIVLVLAGLPLLFLQWTVTWVDFRSILNTAFFGVRIGDITLSPRTILLVIGVLAIGVVITKLLIRWLDARVLGQTRIDKGVQDSLRKGASYTGYILAAGIAFTAAGFEFSNFALIAGALGVGIGFGLQSIVNNFVSGLILLAERPVRVGDWVVLASGEGIVKRINVRSTEIETFDSCSIIVPNSSLITEPVKNWTHGDTMGRFTVNVMVDFASSAGTVRDLLIEITKAHPKVLTYPEPVVTLARIGPYGLDFEIKGNVADIFEGVFVASDIRHTILERFAEKSIVIAHVPVPRP